MFPNERCNIVGQLNVIMLWMVGRVTMISKILPKGMSEQEIQKTRSEALLTASYHRIDWPH